MSAREYKKVKLVIAILLSVLLSNFLFAQNETGLAGDWPKNAIKSLGAGIQSDNPGLKRSCIYYAGFYEIEELVGPLVNQLKKESDPNTRILIALTLCKIGSEEGFNAIKKLAKNDENSKVRRMSLSIINQN